MDVVQAERELETLIERAAAGERVTITRDGEPVAVIGPPTRASPHEARDGRERNEAVRRELGLDRSPPDERSDDEWLAAFNDPAFTREMLSERDQAHPPR